MRWWHVRRKVPRFPARSSAPARPLQRARRTPSRSSRPGQRWLASPRPRAVLRRSPHLRDCRRNRPRRKPPIASLGTCLARLCPCRHLKEPFYPTLNDGRESEPPNRKLKNHSVRPLELRLTVTQAERFGRVNFHSNVISTGL